VDAAVPVMKAGKQSNKFVSTPKCDFMKEDEKVWEYEEEDDDELQSVRFLVISCVADCFGDFSC
jgi:hypothetical protein